MMNKTTFTAYQYKVLTDTSLTSAEVGALIHMAQSTVRYHRIKIGARSAARKNYGAVQNVLTQEPHSTIVMTLPRKQVALMYDVSITTVKEARRVIRQQQS